MHPTLVFDIETIPDLAGFAAVNGIDESAPCRQPSWPKWPCSPAAKRPAVISCRITCTASSPFPACSMKRRPAQGLVARRAGQQRGRTDPAVLRQHRALHPATRFMERRRLRPAGAALPRADPRRRRRALLGLGRRRQGIQVEQLPGPLPHPPSRPDGRAGDVPAARQCAARPDGQAVRLSRQTGDGRLESDGRFSARRNRSHPQLL